MKKLLGFLRFIALVAILIATSLIITDYLVTKDRLPGNTYIGRINVSFLTKQEALQKIESADPNEVFQGPLTFAYENTQFKIPPTEAGVKLLPQESVEIAYNLTHDTFYIRELITRLTRDSLSFAPQFELDVEKLSAFLANLAAMIDVSPKEASFVLKSEGKYEIVDSVVGKNLNTEKTIELFEERLSQGETFFILAIEKTLPRITSQDLSAFPPAQLLSKYTTYYGTHDSPNRIHNIRLIASWIDNKLLLSGESFSVADAIGDFTPERGFKEAYVIMGGALVPQLGGGTCQIGTTLYNSAALADLEILQRRNHSFYFNIYPLGRDATVYPNQVDLKFKNNTGHPILIKAEATNRYLSFKVYGTPTGKKVVFSPPAVYLLGSDGQFHPSSVREAINSSRPFRTFITRKVYDSTDKLIKEESIPSYYKLYGEGTNVPILKRESR